MCVLVKQRRVCGAAAVLQPRTDGHTAVARPKGLARARLHQPDLTAPRSDPSSAGLADSSRKAKLVTISNGFALVQVDPSGPWLQQLPRRG